MSDAKSEEEGQHNVEGPSKPVDFDFDYRAWYEHEKEIRTGFGQILLRLEIAMLGVLALFVLLMMAPKAVWERLKRIAPAVYEGGASAE